MKKAPGCLNFVKNGLLFFNVILQYIVFIKQPNTITNSVYIAFLVPILVPYCKETSGYHTEYLSTTMFYHQSKTQRVLFPLLKFSAPFKRIKRLVKKQLVKILSVLTLLTTFLEGFQNHNCSNMQKIVYISVLLT